MTSYIDASVLPTTICPACGYPSAGMCAACSLIPQAAIGLRVPFFAAGVHVTEPIAQSGLH